MNKTVVMLLFKDILYDSRVKKEAITLGQNGYNVSIICINEYNQKIVLHERVQIIYINLKTKRIKNQLQTANEQKALKRALRVGRIPILKLIKDILNSFYFYRRAQKVVKDVNPTVIHAHDLNMLPYGALLSMFSKRHLIYDSHELYTEMNGKSKIEKKLGYLIEKFFIRFPDSIITVNPFIGDELKKRYKINSNNLSFVENKPLPSNRTLHNDYFRDKFSLSKSDVILLYQGGFSPNRGIEEILYTMVKLPVRYKLVFMGSGNLKSKMVNMIENFNLNERVFFHELVPSEELLSYSATADIGLILYKNTCLNNYLATPNKLYEYIGAGLPVVASDFPAIKEVVNNKGIGYLCNPDNIDEIRLTILKLESNLSEIKKQCKFYQDSMLWESTIGNLLDSYKNLGVKINENIDN